MIPIPRGRTSSILPQPHYGGTTGGQYSSQRFCQASLNDGVLQATDF